MTDTRKYGGLSLEELEKKLRFYALPGSSPLEPRDLYLAAANAISALRDARANALEEAAKMADELAGIWRDAEAPACRWAAKRIALHIRSLAEGDGSKTEEPGVSTS